MNTGASHIHLGFSPDPYNPGTHICLIFRDEAERKNIVSRFVESGILDDEKVSYYVDTAKPSDVLSWLKELEVDVSEALEQQAFSVFPALDTYCPDGVFAPEGMWGRLKEAYTEAKDEGYPNSRVTGEMTWALRGIDGSDRLIEYEAGINTVVKTHPITAMCQYDANRFSGSLVFQALQVHPYMVANGQIVKNPYYLAEV